MDRIKISSKLFGCPLAAQARNSAEFHSFFVSFLPLITRIAHPDPS
jgi:hypothetical protein